MSRIQNQLVTIILGVITAIVSLSAFAGVIRARTVLCNTRECFFVVRGDIFRSSTESREMTYITGSSNVRSILYYKGHLVGLEKNGKIWFLDEKTGRWINIGKNAVEMAMTDQYLLSISKKGQLYVFDGSSFTYRTVQMDSAEIITVDQVFSEVKLVRRAVGIGEENGQAVVLYMDGSSDRIQNLVSGSISSNQPENLVGTNTSK